MTATPEKKFYFIMSIYYLAASCQCIIPYTQKSVLQHLFSLLLLLEVTTVILKVADFTPFLLFRVPGNYDENTCN